MNNKYYDTPLIFDAVWQAPPIQGEKIGFSCYSPLEKFKKSKFNIKINISKIKTLAINYFNFTAKVFFCYVLQLEQFIFDKLQAVFKLTCLKSEERFNAGFQVEKSINQNESSLSRDRVRGVYIYGARLKEA